MTNHQIATALEQLADLLEFQGTNPFKLRAYRSAARRIEDMSESIAALVQAEEDLSKIEGIGKSIAAKCVTLVQTGKLPQLEEILETVPRSVLDLLRIQGLGPKKAAALFNALDIVDLDQLRAACEAGRVRALDGFGAKTEATILEGIDRAAAAGTRIFWAEADELAARLRDHLSACDAIGRLEFAGSYRRGKETVGDLDILVTSENAEAVMDVLATFPDRDSDLARGDTKMSIRLRDGFQVDLRVVPEAAFGAALQYFTGSKEHNVQVRSMAKERGLKINEWGVFPMEGKIDTSIAGRDEEEVYAQVDLPWIAPELREARREFEWAESGNLPELIELEDLQGDLHMHTTASDGKASIIEMVEAAQARGLKYIAITDHSKRVAMANGLDDERLLAQWENIETLRKSLKGFHLLKGIEVDILENGDLDISDDVLAQADWVTASVHYGGNQPADTITKRVVDALAHPHVDCISHPTGRLLNQRDPYAVDIRAVIEAAADRGKMLELNAHPARLDLNDIHCGMARDAGVLIVINSDAHSVRGFEVLRYGIKQARRAGLTKKDVANTLPWPKLSKRLK